MISTLNNNNGYIWAYIEWEIVDLNGRLKNNGEYIFIQNLWIHEDHRESFGKFKVIMKLVPKIAYHKFAEKAKYVYWEHEKRGDRQAIFDIRRFTNRGNQNVKKIISEINSVQV